MKLSWHSELSTWLLPSSRVCRKGMSALKAATSAGRTAGQVATSAWQKPGASPSLSSCKEVHACEHATRCSTTEQQHSPLPSLWQIEIWYSQLVLYKASACHSKMP